MRVCASTRLATLNHLLASAMERAPTVNRRRDVGGVRSRLEAIHSRLSRTLCVFPHSGPLFVFDSKENKPNLEIQGSPVQFSKSGLKSDWGEFSVDDDNELFADPDAIIAHPDIVEPLKDVATTSETHKFYDRGALLRARRVKQAELLRNGAETRNKRIIMNVGTVVNRKLGVVAQASIPVISLDLHDECGPDFSAVGPAILNEMDDDLELIDVRL